jgi:phosphoglycolate phosphatase
MGGETPLIGLLTGNIRPGAELKLGHFQLWDQFEFGPFADDHEDRNQLALKQASLDPVISFNKNNASLD